MLLIDMRLPKNGDLEAGLNHVDSCGASDTVRRSKIRIGPKLLSTGVGRCPVPGFSGRVCCPHAPPGLRSSFRGHSRMACAAVLYGKWRGPVWGKPVLCSEC